MCKISCHWTTIRPVLINKLSFLKNLTPMCPTKFCFKPIKIIRFIYFWYFRLQTLIVTIESRFVTHSIVWTGRVISTQYPHWRAPHWQMEPVITSAQRYTDNGEELIKGEGGKGVVGGCVVGWTHYFLTIPSSPRCTFLLSFLSFEFF